MGAKAVPWWKAFFFFSSVGRRQQGEKLSLCASDKGQQRVLGATPGLPFALTPRPAMASDIHWPLSFLVSCSLREDRGALNHAAQSGKTGPVEKGERSRNYLVEEEAARERFNNSR